MLADLFAHTFRNLNELIASSFLIRVGQQPISILRIRVKKHRTPQVGNLKGLEELIPPSHPVLVSAVQDQSGIVAAVLRLLGELDLASPFVFDGSAVAMSLYPMVTMMLCVRKYR
jgi:hypothetical protein